MITKRYIVRHKDTSLYPFIRLLKNGSYDFMWAHDAFGWLDTPEEAENKKHVLEEAVTHEDLHGQLEIYEQEIGDVIMRSLVCDNAFYIMKHIYTLDPTIANKCLDYLKDRLEDVSK